LGGCPVLVFAVVFEVFSGFAFSIRVLWADIFEAGPPLRLFPDGTPAGPRLAGKPRALCVTRCAGDVVGAGLHDHKCRTTLAASHPMV